jgi:diguanylate cyclase (GGDEF)-like protein
MTALMGSFLGVPLLDEGGCIGVLATTAEDPLAFSLDDERRLRLVASIVSPRLQVARLRRLVVTDPLTCVWNRRALDDLLPASNPGAASSICVAAVDIDRFKSKNDRLGHAVGDRVLREVARALGSALRDTDHVVRVGGDEFLLILRGAAIEQAAGIAERARAAVRAAQVDDATTVSIGVVALRPGETRDALLVRADASLYRAKADGRDRVEVDQT